MSTGTHAAVVRLAPAAIATLSVLALAWNLLGVHFDSLPFRYPMRHTAAVGLLCVASALFASPRGRSYGRWFAFAALLIGGVALAAQAMRWAQITDNYPGHFIVIAASAIHTALPNSVCLLGLGGALLTQARRRQEVHVLSLTALVGDVVAAFATCALLNELGHLITASPAFEGEIAVDGTASFAIAGIAVGWLGRSLLGELPAAKALGRAAAVAIGGTLLTFLVWRTLLHERTTIIADQTASAATALVETLRFRTAGVTDPAARAAALRSAPDLAGVAGRIAAGNFQLFFSRGGRFVYSIPNPPMRYEYSPVAEILVPEFGGSLRLHPGSQFVRQGASWASHLVLAFGLTSSLLLAFSSFLVDLEHRQVVQLEHEVVERQRAEAELEKKARLLAASNEDLEEFARAISHDLQEPLRSVSGFTQLLDRRYKGRLDADADEFIGYITEAVQRMGNMITGLLAYSRIAHRQETSERVDLNEALSWAMKNLAGAIEESAATIHVSALPTVQGHALQLGQVFQNLLGNAIKYRRPNDSPVIHVTYAQHRAEHVITVADNGTGIPADRLGRVFRLFERAHGREYSGTGVGLAVTKRIVQNHGGRIWVKSNTGEGAEFHFTLPDDALRREGTKDAA